MLVRNINTKKPAYHSTLFNVKFKGSDVEVEIWKSKNVDL